MTKKLSGKSISGILFFVLLAFTLFSSCKKSADIKKDDDKPDTLGGYYTDNYIPKEGYIYAYKFTAEDGSAHTIYKGNLGSKDSAGMKVSEIMTTMSFNGEELHLKNKMYDRNGTTITTVYAAQEWARYLNMMRKNVEESGGQILQTSLTGMPFNMIMENQPKVGSSLKFTGGPTKFYLKAVMGTGSNALLYESRQTITRYNGTAVRQETVEIPSGKYDCTVWKYDVDNRIDTYINGNLANTLTSTDKLTVWTKPGLGEVLSIQENTKSGTSTTELITISR
ncbi:hypothetical protein ACFQZX_10235 [Mucilaginibacter litoreus]|uniref:Uncharacterized protein n=1 Tax=Mucilaginibacter litoreus TaxID=1048221 RepID=A0ABW3ASG1_9SPHI